MASHEFVRMDLADELSKMDPDSGTKSVLMNLLQMPG